MLILHQCMVSRLLSDFDRKTKSHALIVLDGNEVIGNDNTIGLFNG